MGPHQHSPSAEAASPPAPDGACWLLYAAKSTDDPTPRNRQTRAQPFTWNPDNTPNFATPLKDGPINTAH